MKPIGRQQAKRKRKLEKHPKPKKQRNGNI